jgi:hypothetical protein
MVTQLMPQLKQRFCHFGMLLQAFAQAKKAEPRLPFGRNSSQPKAVFGVGTVVKAQVHRRLGPLKPGSRKQKFA